MRGREMVNVRERKKHRGFWWGNLKERDHMDELPIGNNKIGLQKCHGKSWN
jgi:hypothetical protein